MEVMGEEIVFLLIFWISRFKKLLPSQMAKPKTTVKI